MNSNEINNSTPEDITKAELLKWLINYTGGESVNKDDPLLGMLDDTSRRHKISRHNDWWDYEPYQKGGIKFDPYQLMDHLSFAKSLHPKDYDYDSLMRYVRDNGLSLSYDELPEYDRNKINELYGNITLDDYHNKNARNILKDYHINLDDKTTDDIIRDHFTDVYDNFYDDKGTTPEALRSAIDELIVDYNNSKKADQQQNIINALRPKYGM